MTLTDRNRRVADPMPPATDVLFKEARQRRRRRRVGMAGVSAVVVAAAVALGVVLPSSSHGRSARRTATTTSRSHSATSGPPRCSVGQLAATAVFIGPNFELGAIKISNTSAHACSLSGRPQVEDLNVTGTNGTDSTLNTIELPYARAGLPLPPKSPVELSAGGASPQAIVELDWLWCGAPPGSISFEVYFPKWSLPLTVPAQAVSPAGFRPAVPSGCPATALFAVDVVRGLNSNGLVSSTP